MICIFLGNINTLRLRSNLKVKISAFLIKMNTFFDFFKNTHRKCTCRNIFFLYSENIYKYLRETDAKRRGHFFLHFLKVTLNGMTLIGYMT